MRELKFRVWDNLKKEWVSNTNIWRMKTDTNGIGEITPNTFYWKQHPQGLSIQQYTGLKDKNGKEIYEGDILKFSNSEKMVDDWFDKSSQPAEERIVKISRNRFGTYFGQNTDSSHYSFLDYENWEVIGNIFENFKILEK